MPSKKPTRKDRGITEYFPSNQKFQCYLGLITWKEYCEKEAERINLEKGRYVKVEEIHYTNIKGKKVYKCRIASCYNDNPKYLTTLD